MNLEVLMETLVYDFAPVQAPTPQTTCQACSDSQTAFVYNPLGSAFGRRLLQQLPRLQCCSQPPSGSALCGTSECTIVLAAGVVGILVAAVMGIAVLIVIRSWRGRHEFIDREVATRAPPVTRYRVVEVREPPAEEEGKTKECPICWDSFEACQDWRLFPCQHGTCKVCHQKLVNPPGKRSACPLCRLPLVEIIQPDQIVEANVAPPANPQAI